jgi:hypothetical protein
MSKPDPVRKQSSARSPETAPPRAAVPPALSRAWSRREFLAWSVVTGAGAWLPSTASACAAAGSQYDGADAVDVAFAGRVAAARTALGLPGLAVAALGTDGCRCASTGVRVLGSVEPILPDDAWPLAGHAAVVTTAVIAALVERGAVSWTTTLGETLRYQSIPRMHPDWEHVTLWDLLAHHAGLPSYDEPLALLSLATAADGDSSPIRQRFRATARVLAAPASRATRGSGVRPSRVGYLVATTLVESLLDRPFESLVAATLPHVGDAAGGASDVHGHVRRVGRWRVQPSTSLPWSHPVYAPAGGLALPVRVYAEVLQSLLQRGAAVQAPYGVASLALGPAAGWDLVRVGAGTAIARASVDPRGYVVAAVVDPDRARAVVAWSNGVHAGVPAQLVELAGAHLHA